MRALAALIATLIAAPTAAAERTVTVDGLAAIRGGDLAGARAAALSDGLRQAMLTGASLRAETVVDEGQVTSDELRVTATGRLVSHRVIEETQANDVMRLRVEAVLGDAAGLGMGARSCPAVTISVGDAVLAVDPAIDPVLSPGRGDVTAALTAAVARAGAGVGEVGVAVPGRVFRSSATYDALLAPVVARAGLVLRARVTMRGLGGTYFPSPMARPSSVETLIEAEIVDAATGARVASARRGEVARRASTSRIVAAVAGVQLAPARPGLQSLLDGAVAELVHAAACRPVAAAVSDGDGNRLRLAGGARQGLRAGDVVRLGDGGAEWRDESWSTALVTEVGPRSATAERLDGSGEARVATLLR